MNDTKRPSDPNNINVQSNNFVLQSFLKLVLRYILEGLIITLTAYYIPLMYKTSLRKPTFNEIFSIGLTASLTMVILDSFSKSTAFGVRLGTGIGIGKNLITL
jgi:hypothetical protein